MADSKKQTTKHCPQCGNTQLVRFTSLDLKHCTDCHLDIPWYLEPGQKPLLTKGVAPKED